MFEIILWPVGLEQRTPYYFSLNALYQTVQPSRFRRDRPESRLPLLVSRFLNSALWYKRVCVSLSCMSKRKSSRGGGAASGDANTPETGPSKRYFSFMTS